MFHPKNGLLMEIMIFASDCLAILVMLKYGMGEGILSKTKEMFYDMHKGKIDMADSVYAINVGGYIGESIRSEIEYVRAHGKKIVNLEYGNS